MPELDVRPANEASWADLEAVFGRRGETGHCRCQRFKVGWHDQHSMPDEVRDARLSEQTSCGDPDAPETSGLVGYRDGEPIGWVAVEPRSAYPYLPGQRLALAARGQTRDDPAVWVVSCFVARVGFRRQGLMRPLLDAAVDFARARGAAVLEGYPMITVPGEEIIWGEVHVGARSVFEAAGFEQVAHPTKRRVVMRLELR